MAEKTPPSSLGLASVKRRKPLPFGSDAPPHWGTADALDGVPPAVRHACYGGD